MKSHETCIEHEYNRGEKVIVSYEDELKEGFIVAMKIKCDWSHDNDGLPQHPEVDIRYVVKLDEKGYSRTCTREPSNIKRIE